MTSQSLVVNGGKSIMLYRAFTNNSDLSANTNLPATQFKVGVSSGTPTIADTDLANPVAIQAGIDFKDFVDGYPSINYTNFEVTTRCYLDSSEANGNDIDGIALFNNDSTPQMLSVHTMLAESKSDTDEFSFIIRNRLI